MTITDFTRAIERYNAVIRVASESNPGAGAEVSVTVPAGQFWDLGSVYVPLVTSGVAGTRQVALQIDDGGANIVCRVVAQPTQAATLTYNYQFTAGGPDRTVQVNNDVLTGLPVNLVLPPGYRIRTITTGILAGDDFGGALVYAVRYIP